MEPFNPNAGGLIQNIKSHRRDCLRNKRERSSPRPWSHHQMKATIIGFVLTVTMRRVTIIVEESDEGLPHPDHPARDEVRLESPGLDQVRCNCFLSVVPRQSILGYLGSARSGSGSRSRSRSGSRSASRSRSRSGSRSKSGSRYVSF